jgi:hypothetical protein
VKYLTNDLDEAEKSLVENWINTDPQNKKYFEGVRDLWQLTALKSSLEKLDIDGEWNHFKSAIDKKEAEEYVNQQEKFDYQYPEREGKNRKPVVYRMIIASAIAASVLLIFTLGWKWFFAGKPGEIVAKDTTKIEEPIRALVRHEVNTSGKPMAIALQDGSDIILWNNSEINFQEPFAIDKRDIILKGKAKFNVAKDSSRPFTVYCGDISTTALGTEFTVTSNKNESHIVVRLYEGKVVVKPVKTNRSFNSDVYLDPGQEFVYDNNSIAGVNKFKLTDPIAIEDMKSEKLSQDNPSIPQNTSGSWFMFNNQSLDQVFNQLAGMYDVKIIYDKKDITNMYFIGKFEKSDSLEYILRQIGILNNLIITRKDSAFVIAR